MHSGAAAPAARPRAGAPSATGTGTVEVARGPPAAGRGLSGTPTRSHRGPGRHWQPARVGRWCPSACQLECPVPGARLATQGCARRALKTPTPSETRTRPQRMCDPWPTRSSRCNGAFSSLPVSVVAAGSKALWRRNSPTCSRRGDLITGTPHRDACHNEPGSCSSVQVDLPRSASRSILRIDIVDEHTRRVF